MEEQKTEGQVQEQQRPGLLSVLCILTWIGNGLGLLFGILVLIGAGALMAKLGRFGGALGAAAGLAGIIGLVLCAGKFFGAIMMWKLKKTGFYLFAVSAILTVVPAQITLIKLGLGFDFGTLLKGLIVPVIFIVLYGINLKAMK